MVQLIDKSALVAEIEKRYEYWREKEFNSHSIESEIRMSECQYLMLLLNTIETKEVDLDESARYYLLHEHISPLNEVLHQADLKVEMQYHKDIEDAYKAGFELGLKAKGE